MAQMQNEESKFEQQINQSFKQVEEEEKQRAPKLKNKSTHSA